MKKFCVFGNRLNPVLKKILRVMKLTTVIMLISMLHVSATVYSQATKLTLNMEDATIKEVLLEIESMSKFRFIYQNEEVDLNKKVDAKFDNEVVENILNKLFEEEDINYSITATHLILIKPGQELENERYRRLVENEMVQQKTVSGTVTDQSGQPLPGVTVVVKGTIQGTVTNADGEYSLANIPDNATLVFSFVGMRTQEIEVGNQRTIDLQMQVDAIGIEEVVAIGYGTQKKATVTGSIATVQGEELQKMPATNLASTLAGRMTGVVVNTRGSAPGAESVQINIRGKNSWQGGGPLIIIDGIANRSGFERLNPNDIESISILKDASAAIYGSRAANGVILVTTKRGKEGKPTIEYIGDFGVTQPTRIPELTNSWQYATYYTEAKRNGYMWSDEEIEKFRQGSDHNLYPNYEPYDLLIQDFAPQTTHTVSLRGGNDAVKYYVSGQYLYQESFFKEGIDDFNNYSVRSNIDAHVHDNLTLSFNLLGRREDKRRAVGSDFVDNIDVGFFQHFLHTDPTKPLYYSNGYPAIQYDYNVAEAIKGKAGENNNRTTTLNSQVTAKWDLPFILEGLFLEGTAAYDFANTRQKQFSKSYDYYSYSNATGEYTNLNTTPIMDRGLYDYYYNSYKYTLNGKLGYTYSFGEHNINTFVAYEQYSVNTEWIQATRNTFLSDQIPFLFAGDANTQKNDGSGYEFAYRNYFGRFAYTYKEKYLFEFSLRRDESLKFPPDKRIGWFPGISAGWRISEEDFIKGNYDFVDNLKLRASYGQMGSDNVGDYQYLATAALYGSFDSYVLGSNPSVVSTMYFSGTPNPNITWEVANSYNVALDGMFWQGLLGFELEYFYSKRNNILATRNASVPIYTGMTLPSENIGKAQNQGVELLLTHYRKLGDFSYNINGNVSFTANKIIYMDESPNVPDYQRREGHPIDSWLLYKTDGIFNTQEEFDATEVKRAGAQVGDIKFVDVNGDKVIDDLDRVRLYDSTLPKVIYGLNLDFRYKGFEFNMLWQGQGGAKTYINPTTRNGDINPPLWLYKDRWTPENAEKASMPRAFYHRSDTYNTIHSDFWLRDASFLRLKSAELGYSLPKDFISKASLSSARIYLNGSNLLLLDKVKDYDPEVVNDLGIFYPVTRTFNVGVQLTF